MTSIVGSASGILENQKVLTQEREMELVQDIKDEAQWLIRIVENLLSVTRINGENARINTEDEVVEEIAVEDDGQGIKESVLPVMFEGKISSDEEESDSKRNMGIGLSVCHSIVKAHKGGMHAENRAEGGARISFWLPMNEEDTDGY
ncbi:MAG: ATP-binding protein [Candidatus Choladocola sp.]|nr:ATP-binding protein [Candidatus Choladocola sp.]